MGSGLIGKSVIVTGAARGVGRATARGFVRAGAHVVMADIDEALLEREVEILAGEVHDGKAVALVGDLRQKLEGALGRTRVAVGQPQIGIDNPDQRHHGKVMPLGD